MRRALLVLLLTLAALPAGADEPSRAGMGEMGDPYVPAVKRHPSTAAPTRGAALQAQVDEKLRRQFAAADVGGTGFVSKEEAQRAGWGYLVRHFEQVDVAGRGSVSLEEVRGFQRAGRRGGSAGK